MRIVLVIISLFFSLVLNAQTASDLFLKANNLYSKEAYSEAIKTYLSINEQSVESSDLYFNLGNCYYKLNKIAPSIYYYEKALKLDPNRKETCGGYGNLLLKFNQHSKALSYIKKSTGFISFTQKDFKII